MFNKNGAGLFMTNEQLSKDFWLREFLASDQAARAGRTITPTPHEVDNLRRLCTTLIQPLRTALGLPMVITSGLRPEWLNELVGGSKTSMHRYGLAADIKVVGLTPLAFCHFVQGFKPEALDQCIFEFGEWTHLGVALEGMEPRREYRTARNVAGIVSYPKGLPA